MMKTRLIARQDTLKQERMRLSQLHGMTTVLLCARLCRFVQRSLPLEVSNIDAGKNLLAQLENEIIRQVDETAFDPSLETPALKVCFVLSQHNLETARQAFKLYQILKIAKYASQYLKPLYNLVAVFGATVCAASCKHFTFYSTLIDQLDPLVDVLMIPSTDPLCRRPLHPALAFIDSWSAASLPVGLTWNIQDTQESIRQTREQCEELYALNPALVDMKRVQEIEECLLACSPTESADVNLRRLGFFSEDLPPCSAEEQERINQFLADIRLNDHNQYSI